jgi:DNA-binding transcriptional regulator YdaS (Cro superfamily)
MTKAPLYKILNYTTEAEIARYFNITPAAVNQWNKNGIPAERIIGLEALTKNQVSRHEMNSKLYPVN